MSQTYTFSFSTLQELDALAKARIEEELKAAWKFAVDREALLARALGDTQEERMLNKGPNNLRGARKK